MEEINDDDFDYLGIIQLTDAKGIEFLTEPLSNGKYLSRNKEYYKDKSCVQASKERNRCRNFLPLKGKKAFVIVERMLNDSCRVFYSEFQELLKNEKLTGFRIAQKCLEEDVENIIRVMSGKTAVKTNYNLPQSGRVTSGRQIEADHKKILLETVKKLPKQRFVINPLIGGILIGPFFRAIHSSDYCPVLFGMHDQNSLPIVNNGRIKNITGVIPPRELRRLPKEILIFDDNVGTGETLEILKNTFEKLGKRVKTGALEMSWDYYDQIKRNLRSGKLFNPRLINYPTYRSNRHHSLSNELINALAINGDFYLKMLKLKGFHNLFLPADSLLYFRGKSICEKYNIRIKDYLNIKSNLILSVDIMKKKIRYLEDLEIDEAIKNVLDFPEVNIIDIDRHQGKSANLEIVKKILALRKCRVGGGIKEKGDIKQLLNVGAKKIIVGAYATEKLLRGFPKNKIVIAMDSIDRKTGKRRNIPNLIKRFEPHCDEFQYVCVETDGKALGGDIKNAIRYSKLTKKKFNCVGGIASKDERDKLAKYNIGCVVGRALEEGYYS